jgi:hypothetical protein
MSGIHNGVVRFVDFKRGVAAVEMETSGLYSVLALQIGDVEVGDEVVGNLDHDGAIDLFNRTRRDRINAVVKQSAVTRDDAIREMQHD